MLEGVVAARDWAADQGCWQASWAVKPAPPIKSFDTWFIGFSPDLAVGVFAGFDKPRSLGRRETGSSVAVPDLSRFYGCRVEGPAATALPYPQRGPSGARQRDYRKTCPSRGNEMSFSRPLNREPSPKPKRFSGSLPLSGRPSVTSPRVPGCANHAKNFDAAGWRCQRFILACGATGL